MKSKNVQGMTIAETTHKKLTSLKKENETFDDVVRKLIEMDKKYNSKSTIIEYEFLTYDISKVFRVIFEKNSHKVEYYSKKGFENHISAWKGYPPISEEDKDLFIEFIVQEKSFRLLQDMGESMDFGNFMIRKIG